MKKPWQSKTLWIALFQAVLGFVVVLESQYPTIGYVVVLKSALDIAIRMMTFSEIE